MSGLQTDAPRLRLLKERINSIDGAATPPFQGAESILHAHSFPSPTMQ